MTGATAEKRAAIRRLQITASRELASLLTGACRSRHRGQGMEFSDLRPYLPGDDIRRIDWSATARTGQPYTRLYEEERSRTITLLADISPSCTPAKRRLLSEAAGLLAFAAVSSGDRLAMIAFSDRVEQMIRPGRGIRQAQRIASELFTLKPTGTGSALQPALSAAMAMNRKPGLFILLSDLHCQIPLQLLRQLTVRHDLATLLLRDCNEVEPPPTGLALFRDTESAEIRFLDLASTSQRRSIMKLWQNHDHKLMRTLHTLSSRTAILRTDRPTLPELILLFRQRGAK